MLGDTGKYWPSNFLLSGWKDDKTHLVGLRLTMSDIQGSGSRIVPKSDCLKILKNHFTVVMCFLSAYYMPLTAAGAQHRAVDKVRSLLS